MATYAIGDLQGCFDELQDLLDRIHFDQENDQLWFAGDLVNRGPKSLECLRFVKNLGDDAKTVLGNHDLHLLAIANGVRKPHHNDTFDDILNAEDKTELLDWLKKQNLLVHDNKLGFTIIHAGLPPQWSLQQAIELAKEIEALIKGNEFDGFLNVMYGDEPGIWQNDLSGFDRYRYIINCFTRLRYCTLEGQINFSDKGAPGTQKKSLIPWYRHPKRESKDHKILFGHWSTVHLGIDNNFQQWNVFPLDKGCLWGGELTALRLQDETWFSVPSRQKSN